MSEEKIVNTIINKTFGVDDPEEVKAKMDEAFFGHEESFKQSTLLWSLENSPTSTVSKLIIEHYLESLNAKEILAAAIQIFSETDGDDDTRKIKAAEIIQILDEENEDVKEFFIEINRNPPVKLTAVANPLLPSPEPRRPYSTNKNGAVERT